MSRSMSRWGAFLVLVATFGVAPAHAATPKWVVKELRERYPLVPWAKAKGMRNVVVHGYFDIDWDDVWRTATEDIPLLRAQMVEVFKAEFPDDTLEL